MSAIATTLWKIVGGGYLEKLLTTVFGDKAASNEQAHTEAIATLDQFAKEFSPRSNRTWFDSFVDGLNRLPRPLLTFGVMGLLGSAMYDPAWFAERMVALQVVPEWLAILFSGIVLFFFGARELNHQRSFKAKSTKEVSQIVDQMREIRSLDGSKAPSEQALKPTGNSVIDEWKRQQAS